MKLVLWILRYKNYNCINFFRFPCGRYLGKSVDDGSTERLLVGELIKTVEPEAGDTSVNTSTPSAQTRSPMMTRRDTRLSVAEIQHMIGKKFYFNSREKLLRQRLHSCCFFSQGIPSTISSSIFIVTQFQNREGILLG